MKNQFYPFDDFPKYSYSDYDNHGEERPWRQIAEEMRKYPHEQKSEMLSHLTDVYRTELKNNGQDKALEKFWHEVDLMRKCGLLTDDMQKVLLAAKAGNIKAAQKMVRAFPVVIHLPFIAQVLRYVVSQHKYCDPGKKGPLATIRDQWNDFLPSRPGGNITYSDSDLKRLVLLAKKQETEARKSKIDRLGRNVPLTFTDVRENVANELNISAEYIKKNIHIIKKRGRSKK